MQHRVLQVLNSLGRGGIESVVTDIYKNINRERIQFDFCIVEGRATDHLKEVKRLGANVFYYPSFSNNPVMFRQWWKDFFKEHTEYIAVHGHAYTTASIYLKTAHDAGLRTISHSHSTGLLSNHNNHKLVMCVRKALIRPLRNAPWIDARIACSHEAGRWLFGKKDFKVIYNGIETDKFRFNKSERQRVRKELGIEEKTVFGHVGNATPAKNHLYLLQIFTEIKRRYPNSVLLLIGGLEAKKQEIVKCISSYHIEDSVLVLGGRDDVSSLLQGIDCFFLPSVYEGMPVSLIEAQYSGLPCVISDSITIESDIGAGLISRCSIRFKPDQWCEKIRLLSDEQREGIRAATEKFSIATTVDEIQKVYSGYINAGRE